MAAILCAVLMSCCIQILCTSLVQYAWWYSSIAGLHSFLLHTRNIATQACAARLAIWGLQQAQGDKVGFLCVYLAHDGTAIVVLSAGLRICVCKHCRILYQETAKP